MDAFSVVNTNYTVKNKMKYLFYFGHPAHYHFYIPLIKKLQNNNEIKIVIKNKDVLQKLLENEKISYVKISNKEIKKSKFEILNDLLIRDFKLFKIAIKYKPDLMIGSISDITHVGKLLNIPSIVMLEDDLAEVPQFDKITSPWASCLITPESCDVGKWNYKTVKYNGYQELTYLSEDYFKPNNEIVKNIFNLSQKNYIIRFSALSAYHDVGKSGITHKTAITIIKTLKKYGNVFITSEGQLEPELEKYRININPIHMHHYLYFADIYIGDSQTMTAEAAILGTPSVRFNDFVGKLGYLEELEHKYGLTYGIKTNEEDSLLLKIKELIVKQNLKKEWQKKAQLMLKEKIEVTSFLIWFLENYPKSFNILKKDPDYQYKFN